MRFAADRDVVLNALNHVQGVVERKVNVQALGHVLFAAEQGRVVCTTTNLDLECVESFSADVAESGAASASAMLLHDMARRLEPGAEITFSLDTDANAEAGTKVLRLHCGSTKAAFPALPAEDFPKLDTTKDEGRADFAIPAADLRRLLRKTAFAAATEEIRYYLNGVYLHAAPDPFDEAEQRLCAVATDGLRLAMAWTDLPDGAQSMPPIIVPRSAVRELMRLLDPFEGDVQIQASSTHIGFAMESLRLTTKVVEGAFPEYRRVLPLKNPIVAATPRPLLKRALARAEVVARAQRDMPLVRLTLSNDALALAAGAAGVGDFHESLEATYTGDDFIMGVNANMLGNIISAMDGEETRLKLADPVSPVLALDGGDDKVLFVVMPTRL